MLFGAPLEENQERDEENCFLHNGITCVNHTCQNVVNLHENKHVPTMLKHYLTKNGVMRMFPAKLKAP